MPEKTARLTAENLSKLPSKNTEALLKLAQMKIDANEDASQLLSTLQEQLDTGRPGTGRSGASRRGAPPTVHHNYGAPPSTAGGLSIAGSLRDRITASVLSRGSEFRKGPDALRPSVAARDAARPDTAGSQRPPSTAGSQRPPSTAASQRATDELATAPWHIVDKPPIIDYAQIVPDDVQQRFRDEFRAMKVAEQTASEAATAAAVGRSVEATSLPLGEFNLNALQLARLPTPAGSHASRPLTGHTEYAMADAHRQQAPPVPRPWSKKGRRGAPDDSRAARSEISEALSWQ